ncbi:MAG: hypothetical protein K9G09_05430, partial [Pontimonas sp.]|nr:hypothetical protein [Pontimonas sp.]
MALLSKHISTDPELKEKKEEQWIEHFTALNEGAFISDSQLDELTETNNQVIEALQPDTSELQARLKSAISSAVASGMPKGGHSFDKWVALIVNGFEVNQPALLDDLSKLRHEKCRQWVEKMPDHVLGLVSKTISQQGLAVTSKLLERLIAQVRAAAAELLEERAHHIRDAGQINHTVSQAMGPASSMNAIPVNHPTVANALHQAELAFYWSSMADLKESASELMLDFAESFLVPLQATLSRGLGAPRDSPSNPNLPDNTQNPYAGWPDFSQKPVASRLYPAPNESMLIDAKDFPAEFDMLVEQTVSDPSVTAAKIVVDEVLMGSRSPELSSLADNQSWDVLTLRQLWIPKNRHYQIRQAANQPAMFGFAVNHMDYLEFTKKWLKVPGRAFRSFMDQTIPNYLKASGNQALQSERSKKFLGALNSALQMADPLVDIDETLLAAAHGEIGRRAQCSGIPIDSSDPMREAIDNMLVAAGHDPKGKWYIDGNKAAMSKSIEIVSQMDSSMGPIPMSSMMEPILQEWTKASSSYSSRATFMTFRRGRTLAEAIPAHPNQWQAMLTGWFVGRLLNQLENDKTDPSYKDKGPKVSIWCSPSSGLATFPYPLHSARIVNNVDDLPAAVLDSLIVAMADCHSTGSLAPLAPYNRLLELGGVDGSFEDLENWVRSGVVQQSAPLPRPERAGTPAMTPHERQDACAAYLDELLVEFRAKIAGLDSHADSRTYPISWELRTEIEYALDAGIKAVRSIEPEKEL